MQARRFVLYACSLVLVGCVGGDQRPLTGLSVEPAQTRRGAAAYLFKQCPVNPSTPAEAIPVLALGALAPLLASFAVNVGQNLLKSMEEGLTGQFTAGTASVSLYEDGGTLSFGCIVVVRGLFGAPAPSADSGDGKLTPTHLSKLSLADYPAFYMEAEATLDGASLLFYNLVTSGTRNPAPGERDLA
jgi:hypothetical protein